MKNIIARLEALESLRPGVMRLLCDVDGVQKELTLSEYKATPGAHWIKVLGGGSLADVDYLLRGIEALAHDMAKGDAAQDV